MPADRIQIVPAEFAHAEQLAESLRDGDAMEIAALGFRPLECLDAVLCRSVTAHSALVESEVAAMWGFASASLLGDSADLWMFTGQAADGSKVTLMKESLAFVLALQSRFRRLRAMVALDYGQAVRWLRWLGFQDGEIETYGGRAFMRVTRYGR